MKNLKLIKGACCALMMMSSEFALAGWENLNNDVNITQSRAALDRVNRVYFAYVTVENTGSEAIDGPFRVLIADATLLVLNSQGATDDGVPYFDLDMPQLMPGESYQVRVDFELQRKRLSFSASLQNDVAGWEMVWNDEFDGVSIDNAKWTRETNCDGGGNQEKQCYTDSDENSFVEDGILKIVAKSESGLPLPYSSARLVSKEQGDWTYGRFEIRAKAPSGQGSWPAIWMLPTDNEYGGWPHSGEIDIFESVNLKVPLIGGGEESNVHGTLHYGESWPDNDSSGYSYLLPSGENPADGFHTYAIEWEEGEMRWYVDGVLYQTQLKSEVTYNTDGNADGLEHRGWYREQNGEYFWDESPFDKRFHMILNFAVGGSWPENVNQGGVDASAFNESNAFEVDYVRVYECSVNPTTGQGCATVTDAYLDPIDAGGTLNYGAAPTPVAPSDGIAEDLFIFEESFNPAWPAWDCCGGSIPTIEYEDGDYLNVVEFVVGATPTVLGFNTNFADTPAPYDGSPMEDTGVLEFDLKLVTPPNNASAGWNLKVEQGGTTTEAVISIATPTATWQHYAIPLKTLGDAGLNLNGIDVIMIFPDWGQGEGAVFRVDNVTILEGEADDGGDGGTESDLPAIDFEAGGFGASLSWNVFENADNPAVEFVANPDTSGINDSATVAKITARLAGAPWVGAETAHGDFGPMTLDVSNSTIKIMVYKTVISDVGIKFAIANGGAQPEIKVANTKINQWEELTFDFSGYIGLFEAINIDQIIVFPDFDLGGRSQENVVYFDNIRFFGESEGGDGGGSSSGEELLTNGSFEDGTDSWIGTVEVVSDNGNNVFYANVQAPGNPWDVNLSQVITLVPDETYVVSFKAKSPTARSIIVGLGLNHDPWTNVIENTALTDQWQTYTYTITAAGFGDDNSRVLFDLGAEVGEVFIDDVSVKVQGDDGGDGGDGGGSSSDLPAIDFEAGGYGASLSWNVFENAENAPLEFVANPDGSGINDSSTVAKITARVDGAPWVGTETAHGDIGPFTLDATNSTIKIMVYKTVISDVGIKFAIANGGAQPEIKVANTLINQWEELTFDFSGKIGLFESIDIDQIIIFPDFASRTQDNVVYFDNIRFISEDDDTGGGDGGDGGDGGGTDTGEDLVGNGSFDNGGEGWIGAVNVVQEDGNNVFMADVATAGNPWDVNLSYPMTLVPDETYILSFKAKASLERTIVAGLGLNYDPWTNIVETVSLSTQWQTFSYTMTLAGFGGENSRVLFDLGAEAGVVYIDDVSVTLEGSSDGGGPVAEDTFVLISSTGATDIEFVADTVGEWSTGTNIQGDVTFDGLSSWEMTSSSNSPEAGNWGTVLAFQNGINGDFSLFNRIELKIATTGTYAGGYKVAISGNGVNKEFGLPVNESISTWQTVSLDAADIPINMSSIDWIAVYGIGGQPGVSTIYVTDFSLLKDETIVFDSSTEDDFVFISSDPAVTSDLIVDDDNSSDVGNVIFGEWSTGTIISETTYDGLDGIELIANGSWGAVLALQGDISDGSNIDNYDVDFSKYTNIKMKVASQGGFERYAMSIVSNIDGNEVAQEVGFSLASQSQWNEIDIDLGMYGIDLSKVSQIALFGVYQGGSAAQNIYITDLIAYDTGKVTATKDSSDDKFVFFSSTGETSDMVFDGDDYAHNGNMTINDWSTGTSFASDVTYSGLSSFELTRGSGSWGAVLALMGDINGDVQEYDFDVAAYSTLNFKIAAQGAFSEYTLDFLVDGAEFKVPLTVNSSWTEVSINLADIPINFSKLTQIAIFGVGGGAGNKIYLTDLNLSK